MDRQNIYGWMDDNTCKFTSYMHKKKYKIGNKYQAIIKEQRNANRNIQ